MGSRDEERKYRSCSSRLPPPLRALTGQDSPLSLSLYLVNGVVALSVVSCGYVDACSRLERLRDETAGLHVRTLNEGSQNDRPVWRWDICTKGQECFPKLMEMYVSIIYMMSSLIYICLIYVL